MRLAPLEGKGSHSSKKLLQGIRGREGIHLRLAPHKGRGSQGSRRYQEHQGRGRGSPATRAA